MTARNNALLYRPRHGSDAGFTLIEIMVGLAIGMLATMVIMQVFSVFEAQKRTTTGTADAQVNGSIALYNIGRDLQMAGYPLIFTTNSPLTCTTLNAGSTGITDIFPVSIGNDVAASGVNASDRVTVRYGTSAVGGVPTAITAAPIGNDVTVDNNFGCAAGDTTLAMQGATCTLSSASAVSGTTTVTLRDTTGANVGANLSCLGTWNEITYGANNGNLERNGEITVPGIVNLQAQYGVSTSAGSNQVTAWVDASGGTWATPTVVNRNRIKAIRIAVVARNAKKEPTDVTGTCTTAKGTVNNGPCAWDDGNVDPAPRIDLSADPEWRRYRYRVFETIIPLRNVIWSKDGL